MTEYERMSTVCFVEIKGILDYIEGEYINPSNSSGLGVIPGNNNNSNFINDIIEKVRSDGVSLRSKPGESSEWK